MWVMLEMEINDFRNRPFSNLDKILLNSGSFAVTCSFLLNTRIEIRGFYLNIKNS